jgi:hypothetical protein
MDVIAMAAERNSLSCAYPAVLLRTEQVAITAPLGWAISA